MISILSRPAVAMSRFLPILTSIVLLVAFGLAEGYWTDRWALSNELAEAPGRLAAIPHEVGDWHGQPEDLSSRQARQGEIRASLVRRYANRQTGEAVDVLLVCGRAGPIAVHAPEVCLGGAGFAMTANKVRRTIEATGQAGGDEFWVARFHRPGAAVPDVVDVCWSWNSGGGWQAVENPRVSFAPRRLLYKLYVSRPLPRSARDGALQVEMAPIHQFLKVFLPEVQRTLFPG
jgi:hypothetical protein